MNGRSGLKQKIPQHVAIVMDGNGRWAVNQGLPRSEGHRAGVDVVKNMVKTCVAKHIPILSVWAFGRENWNRPSADRRHNALSLSKNSRCNPKTAGNARP